MKKRRCSRCRETFEDEMFYTKVCRYCKMCARKVRAISHKKKIGEYKRAPAREAWSISKRLAFYSKLNEQTGCLEWHGAKQNGRGALRLLKKNYRAHRLAYECAYGPLVDEICVLHKCDNPVCINPQHLFLGTQADNMRDMNVKKRHWSYRGKIKT